MLSWFRRKKKQAPSVIEKERIEKETPVESHLPEQSPVETTTFEPEKERKEVLDSEPDKEQEETLESEPEKILDLEPEETLESEPEKEQEETLESEPEKILDLEPEETKQSKGSFFSRLSKHLDKTKESLTYQLDTLLLGKKEIDANLLDDLEELLITADVGVATTEELLETIRRRVKRKELTDPEKLKKVLKKQIKEYVVANEDDGSMVLPKQRPFVIMVIGVNGVGKTTTIGKIAHKFIRSGQSVMLAAGDTFRAAAVSQLKIWGERNGIPVVAHKDGSDPSSVVFDALTSAMAKDIDVLLVDTAGRMHTKDNLMAELQKIKRVMAKKLPKAPHETLLVLDATTGQNALSQARLFDDAVKVSGLALTKLDGTSKGGIVINICREMEIPIRFIGIGEQIDDLRDFDAEEFVDALFDETR